jgi:hypothetical protein
LLDRASLVSSFQSNSKGRASLFAHSDPRVECVAMGKSFNSLRLMLKSIKSTTLLKQHRAISLSDLTGLGVSVGRAGYIHTMALPLI